MSAKASSSLSPCPKKAGAEPIEPDKLEPLVLSIDREGRLFVNIGDPDAPQTADRILEIASAALRREPGRSVLVKADTAVAYGRVVEGMVLLQKSGAKKVGFVTEPVADEWRPPAPR